MTNNNELVFNWSLNGKHIEEKFSVPNYEPQEDAFEICDYIFQYHEVLNVFDMQSIAAMSQKNLRQEEALNTILSIDNFLLEKVILLKILFSKLLDYDDRYFKRLNEKHQQAESDSKTNLHKWRSNYIEKNLKLFVLCDVKDVSFLARQFDDLKEGCEEFVSTGSVSSMREALDNLRKKIQQQADFIVDKVEELYQKNLWKILGNCLPNENLALQKFGQALDKMNKEYEEIQEQLKEAYVGYKKIVNKGGCFAICVAGGRKIYALSGNDYKNGSISSGRYLDEDAGLQLEKIANFINLESIGYERAVLNDDTMNYIKSSGVRIYFEDAVSLKNDFRSEHYNIRNYTCCERKILSILDSSDNNLKFFIRYKPCQKCVPAMASDGARNIVSYVISEQLGFTPKFFISKVVIQDKSYINHNGYKEYQYELTESIIVN